MKLKLVSLLIVLAFYTKAIAQHKLHFGIEIGPKKEHFIFDDPHLILYKKEYRHTIKGINISYELDKNYTIESGIYSTPRTENINFSASVLHGWNRPDRMVQVPLRLSRNILSIGTRIQLRGVAGFSYVYNSRATCQTEECYTGSKIAGSKPVVPYVEANIYTAERHIWIGEAGANLSYKLKPKINVALTASYNHGFKPITRIYTEFHPDEDNTTTALAYSKGSSTNFLLKLSYQLFDFGKGKTNEHFDN